jgi:hypothetical protein
MKYWVLFPYHVVRDFDRLVPWYLILFVFLVLGIVWHPFCYGFLLIYFVLTQRTLSKLIDSIAVPAAQIVWTFVLLIALVYAATLAYFAFHFPDLQGPACQSLVTCVMASIDSQWKGSLWDDLLPTPYAQDDGAFIWGRFFLDALVVILIQQIVSTLFTGIITDQFGSFREKQENIDIDCATICFICG